MKQLLRDVLSRFMIAATVWQYATSILWSYVHVRSGAFIELGHDALKFTKNRQKVSTDRLEREPKETYDSTSAVLHGMFAMTRGRLLFALAFAAIGALFAYLLVHHFWTGQSQRAVLVATIYF